MTQNLLPPVAISLYSLCQDLRKTVMAFPKADRYTLGVRLVDNGLNLLQMVFKTNSALVIFRESMLLEAKALAEAQNLLLRMCFESKLIRPGNYFQLAGKMQEIIKMLHGWMVYYRGLKLKK